MKQITTVTIPFELADYMYQDLEAICDNMDGEYSAEDSEAAVCLRRELEDGIDKRKAAKVTITPAIRSMLLEGWSGTDVLDSVCNIAYLCDSVEQARKVKRQATNLRRKLA